MPGLIRGFLFCWFFTVVGLCLYWDFCLFVCLFCCSYSNFWVCFLWGFQLVGRGFFFICLFFRRSQIRKGRGRKALCINYTTTCFWVIGSSEGNYLKCCDQKQIRSKMKAQLTTSLGFQITQENRMAIPLNIFLYIRGRRKKAILDEQTSVWLTCAGSVWLVEQKCPWKFLKAWMTAL